MICQGLGVCIVVVYMTLVIQQLRLALSKRPTRVEVSLPPPGHGTSSV
jgi:hypothetical protein